MMRELLEEYKQKGSKRQGGDREVGFKRKNTREDRRHDTKLH